MLNNLCSYDTCCERGKYQQGQCLCDSGFFGNNCEKSIEEIYPPQYFVFIGIFCTLFAYTLVISLRQVYLQLNTPSENKLKTNLTILISSPVNIILCLSILISILKLIWLILDPFQLYKGMNIIIEHILSDVVYSLLFYIYGYLLMAWYSMYDEISFTISNPNKRNDRKMVFRYYKQFLKVRLFLVLLVQMAVSIFNGLRKQLEYPNFTIFCYSYLLLNFFYLSCEFILYGIRLKYYIRYQLRISQENKKQKILKFRTIQEQLQKKFQLQKENEVDQPSIELSNNVEEKKQEEKKIEQDQRRGSEIFKELYKKSKRRNVTFSETNPNFQYRRQESHRNLSNPIEEQIESDDIESPEKNQRFPPNLNDSCCLKDTAKELEWDNSRDISNIEEVREKKLKIVRVVKERLSCTEIKIKHSKKPTENSGSDISGEIINQQDQTQITQMIDVYEYQKILEKQQFAHKASMLQGDQQIVERITLLMFLGIMLSIFFGILCIIALTTDSIYSDPIGTISYLYVSSLLQFLSLIIVLKLFRNISNQQIKNLIWIQKVGSKNNQVNQNYSFVIPGDFKQNDEMLQKFETRINLITLY